MASSSDGINWTSVTNPFTTCLAIAYNGIWVVGGTGSNRLMYSQTGVEWSTGNGNTIFTTACNSIAWNGTMFVAGGQGTNTLAFSYNGIDWCGLGATIFNTQCKTVAWKNNIWIAGGSGGNRMAYSSDGFTWKESPSGNNLFYSAVLGISFTPVPCTVTRFVAVGVGNDGNQSTARNIAFSYDSIH